MASIQLKDEPKVVIIGAGVGGLITAITLKRQLGLSNFVIYEKANELGGTWRDNTYPGCACDNPIHFYSLSTDLNPEWSNSHCDREEIQTYWLSIANKYAIRPRIIFDTAVSGAVWDAERQLWIVTTEPMKGGKKETVEAKVVISALGVLDVPQYPKDIEGREKFKGVMFHSARWNWDVSLKGKRVAVVGNGASATQFIPRIANEDGIEVVQFSRSPTWFVPSTRMDYPGTMRWMFRHVPYFMRLTRIIHFWLSELFYFLVFYSRLFKKLSTKFSTSYIKQNAPPEYVDWLIPNYAIGCKRVIFDSGYLEALRKKNVRLNTNGIQRFEEKGIITKNGEVLDFDVIIFATGFESNDYPLEIRGTDKSTTLRDYYTANGGPIAYRGTVVHGFPNFFLLLGANTSTGHTTAIYSIEVQLTYITKLLRPIMKGVISSLQVTTKATDAYNQIIQKRLAKTIYTSCTSWYRKDRQGKVTRIWPGSGVRLWFWLRKPNFDHYSVGFSPKNSQSEDEWNRYKKQQRGFRVMRTLFLVLSLAGATMAWCAASVF